MAPAVRRAGPLDQDSASSLAVSGDASKVIVTGDSSGGAVGSDYATIAYDARTSSRLWLMRYDGPGHGDDVASALTISPNGSTVFVTGHSQGPHSGVDLATLAYDATTGARLWVSRYDQRRLNDNANSIAVSPDGSKVFVAGDSEAISLAPDFATVAYQAEGGVQSWLYVYGNASVAKSVGVTPDGSRVVVTGVGSSGFATVAHDAATGLPIWVRGFNPGNHRSSAAAALAVDPGGSNVFVTGWADGGQTSLDFATVAYQP
jgi:WD40 repeat protein